MRGHYAASGLNREVKSGEWGRKRRDTESTPINERGLQYQIERSFRVERHDQETAWE
jgi:hypothetical protein